jgi:hypothetical protein
MHLDLLIIFFILHLEPATLAFPSSKMSFSTLNLFLQLLVLLLESVVFLSLDVAHSIAPEGRQLLFYD